MFKTQFASLALGVALVLSAPALAQTAAPAQPQTQSPSAAHLALARELMDLTNVTATFGSIYTEFRDRTRQMVGVTRPELVKDLNEVVDALKPEADKKIAEITGTATGIFAKAMSEADLKETVAFFKSPAGQRYNTTRAKAIEELYTVLEPWSLQTSNFLFDRFSQEMRKRGHNL
ncbi:hypothetical protein ASG72_17630 [Bosea sp. Leaf344]|jgi:uncharacterized protein|uniref:DUF2059 domain-containing protein n=1 Tax=Bosea sp. Leaf344 TaxID=1736346 RepID=UPI0006F238AB|nr:DUF2059 domain-containing protein [Bosea sp. Leaf344]KQU50428.1 hypothetical protein ASG72_17630 [Bosea sp. Leaf344]